MLFIVVDDLGYHDLGCQGATDLRTPQIDRLAASGARCTTGYVTAPQCSPSRAGMMTSMSQSRFGFFDNEKHRGLPPRSVVELLPEQMKSIGYATAIFGKWHIGDRAHNGPDWEFLPNSAPWERGFDLCVLHNDGMAHYQPYSVEGRKWMTERARPFWLAEKTAPDVSPRPLKDLPQDTYLTDYFSERAGDFIRTNRQRPWFLFLSYNAPHTPLTPLESDLAAHADIKNPLRRQFAAVMTGLDRGVGKVLSVLDATGQRDRTLIWFISDNGAPTHHNASRNDPFRGHKGDTWEGGIRVPFLVSWPGRIPAGQTFTPMVSTLDVLPTSLAAAGRTNIAAIHEGKNLLPLLTGRTSGEAHDALFWHWRNRVAVRLGNFKENRNGPAENSRQLPEHLFVNFTANPFEDPAMPLTDANQQARLIAALDTWLKGVMADSARLTPKQVTNIPATTQPKN
ncbi:MAG: sulfatase-like hydrolase/transferase [Verrucomicrobia bacterium]|nr:sulfatase-like hydrolase/transferase [Verrucomicrobiota bacterium]